MTASCTLSSKHLQDTRISSFFLLHHRLVSYLHLFFSITRRTRTFPAHTSYVLAEALLYSRTFFNAPELLHLIHRMELFSVLFERLSVEIWKFPLISSFTRITSLPLFHIYFSTFFRHCLVFIMHISFLLPPNHIQVAS